jgi:uncharacterized membrane protein
MKKQFITGLIILLPIAVTIAFVFFIINFLTNPFVNFIEHFLEEEAWFYQYRALIHFALQIIMLLFLFFFTLLLGFLARAVVFKSLLALHDFILHRIPILKTIYKAMQQLIRTLFGTESRSFKQVVMVRFPNATTYCIGLVASQAPSVCEKTMGGPLVTVFVPTTPNPTSGFLMMYPTTDLIYLDMKVEDAFKYIISCGVITADTPDIRKDFTKEGNYIKDEIESKDEGKI